jgi:hypothetical protein
MRCKKRNSHIVANPPLMTGWWVLGKAAVLNFNYRMEADDRRTTTQIECADVRNKASKTPNQRATVPLP